MQEVTLAEMLDAREARAAAQAALQARFPNASLISFTLNIPGPVKVTPAVVRAFHDGCRRIDAVLIDLPVVFREARRPHTGCEALWAVEAPALSLKEACAALEDKNALGRLFDIDVLAPNGRKIDRAEVGKPERGCMVCGAPGRGCASRRLHSVPELQAAAFGRIDAHFRKADAARIGALAAQALRDEVCATPKPGLVDRNNTGSHKDMDLNTFLRSADALEGYFITCTTLGMEGRSLPPEVLFSHLRAAGLEAEAAMFAATDGINTHKGAIYTLGVLCGAIGYRWTAERPVAETDVLLDTCAALTAASAAADFAAVDRADPKTAGERLYLQYGLRGIRGEVADGLPALRSRGLPAFRRALADGHTAEESGILALLHLIAHTDDTTLWHRGGRDGAAYAQRAAADLLKASPFPTAEQIAALDRDFIARRLSPGGCADLLAVLFFLHRLQTEPEA